MPLLLGVNIDHVASLRQARYARMPEAFNAEPSPLDAAADALAGGAEMIELHTGAFANAQGASAAAEVARLAAAARAAHQDGLQVNAGHGINYLNATQLFAVPHLAEFNTGHSDVARAVRLGLTTAVREMKALISGYPG